MPVEIPLTDSEQTTIDRMVERGESQESIDAKKVEFQSAMNSPEKRAAVRQNEAELSALAVPSSLTPAQFEMAITEDEDAIIESFIAGIADPVVQRRARIWRDKATSFDRYNEFLLSMAELIVVDGVKVFPESRLDEIWRNGKAEAI